MAQIVKLKRTAVSGKIPTTSNLELGELAMNTYDGRIFFEKDDGSATIQEIITTNPSTHQTGSIVLNGDVTASFFIGDGSNLTFGDTGIISGSSQVNADSVTNFDSNVLSYINILGVASGSSSGYSDSDNTDHLNSLGVLSGSGQVDHDSTLNFVANEHIDHSSITIGSGKGLSGGGTIDTSRSLTLDTGSNHFVNGVKTKLDSEQVLSGSTHSGNQTFSDNVTISGDLTVDGTTTSVNSTEVNIGDNMIVLNSDETGTPSQDAGIEIERGTSTNVKFQFKESTDRWQFTNDGSTFFNLPTSTADVSENSSNLYYTDARVKTKLNIEGVISGSSQVVLNNADKTGFNTADVSEDSSNLYYTDARVKTKLNVEGVISGSSQVNANSVANFDSNVDARLNTKTVISGSSQVVLNDADKTGFDTADVSEHSSNLYYTDARVKTKLNTEGVISGSTVLFHLTGSTVDSPNRAINAGDIIRINSNHGIDFHVADDNDSFITVSLDESTLSASTGPFYRSVNNVVNDLQVISGSAQITNLTTYKETVSGATSYQIDHNLGEQYPIVQCWSTHTSQQEIPELVTSNSTNRVTVEFYTTFAGVIIVKK